MSAKWLLGVPALVVDLLFCVYFVCVQINAIAYLAGKGAIISGVTPPLRIHSDAAAAADILIGLFLEAFTALVMAIAIAVALTSLCEARRVRRLRLQRPGVTSPEVL